MSEPHLEGFGPEAVDEVAQLEFGGPEEVRGLLGDQQPGDGEEVVGEGVREFQRESLGLGFEFGSERGHDRILTERTGVEIAPQGLLPVLCTKIPPTGDTLTRAGSFPAFVVAGGAPLRYAGGVSHGRTHRAALMSNRPDDTESFTSPPPRAADPAATTLMPSDPAGADASATPLPSPPGYEVLRELGRGGMGVVYQARQLGLNRVVAIKMILSGPYAGDERRQRFRAEAEAVARLQHPNIVQVHEVGEHAGTPFFSMEFCPGGALDRKLNATPLPASEAARLVETLARAVQAAHEKAVVHRDLKPANILLAEDGAPKVTDFGLAKRMDEAGQTQSGAVIGTPSYMAPEQAGGKSKDSGPACDVYALGAILYECLTGRPPFKAPTMLDTLAQVLSADAAPPRQLQPHTPRDLETICLHCLRKNPRQRYPSAAALAEDLRRFLDGQPIRVRPAGAVERLVKWARRRPTAAALLGVSVAAVLAGLGLVGWYQLQLYRKNADLARALDEARKQQVINNGWAATAVDALGRYGDMADDVVAPLPESDKARRALLEQRLRFFAPFEALASDDPLVRRRKAAGLFEAARIRQKLGEDDAAEKELNESIRLYEQAAPDEAGAPETRYELGRTCVQLGLFLATQGRWDEADRQYDRGVGLLLGLIDDGRTDPPFRSALAEAYRARAVRQGEAKNWPEALGDMQRSVDLGKGLVAEDGKNDRYKALLGTTYAGRCSLYRLKGEPAQGRDDADAAVVLFGDVGPDILAEEGVQDSLATVHFHRGLAR